MYLHKTRHLHTYIDRYSDYFLGFVPHKCGHTTTKYTLCLCIVRTEQFCHFTFQQINNAKSKTPSILRNTCEYLLLWLKMTHTQLLGFSILSSSDFRIDIFEVGGHGERQVFLPSVITSLRALTQV